MQAKSTFVMTFILRLQQAEDSISDMVWPSLIRKIVQVSVFYGYAKTRHLRTYRVRSGNHNLRFWEASVETFIDGLA
jgi:hypothetical protein